MPCQLTSHHLIEWWLSWDSGLQFPGTIKDVFVVVRIHSGVLRLLHSTSSAYRPPCAGTVVCVAFLHGLPNYLPSALSHLTSQRLHRITKEIGGKEEEFILL